jgi:methylated-DNA-[protein]-cysteine S-methyltransferase
LTEIITTRRGSVWFSAAVNEKGKLVASAFSDRNRREAEKAVANSMPKTLPGSLRSRRGDANGLRVLSKFYEGNGRRNSIRLLDLTSVSSFRREVYRQLCRIPRGKVTTYGDIAQKLGGKRYSRAVGTAVATNPLPLIVPCHRVVPSSLRVGNYGMCGRDPTKGGYMKREILEREGVRFQGSQISKKSTWFPT